MYNERCNECGQTMESMFYCNWCEEDKYCDQCHCQIEDCYCDEQPRVRQTIEEIIEERIERERSLKEWNAKIKNLDMHYLAASDDPRGARIKTIRNNEISEGGAVVNLRESKYVLFQAYYNACNMGGWKMLDGKPFVIKENEIFKGLEVRHTTFNGFNFFDQDMTNYESFSNTYENCIFRKCAMNGLISNNDKFINCIFLECNFGNVGAGFCKSKFENTQIRMIENGRMYFAGNENDLGGLLIDQFDRNSPRSEHRIVSIDGAIGAKIYELNPIITCRTDKDAPINS